jgi:hypothetical protein
MNDLASYLMAQMPNGMSYSDATQLCLHLYCTVDGVPERLLPLTKEILGDAFAKLAYVGWVRDYSADFQRIKNRSHWVAVLAATFKNGPDVVDMPRGEALARQVGFVKEKGPS